MAVRVGVDLVGVGEIEESVRTHGQKYLARIYTEHELESCSTEGDIAFERLAARFAAKEAAIKVLRPSAQDTLAWSSIEVVSQPHGWVSLRLSGAAAALAAEAGIEDLQLSITHEGAHACAVVVADLRSGCR